MVVLKLSNVAVNSVGVPNVVLMGLSMGCGLILTCIPSRVAARFSPFVKTGSEGFILGGSPSKVAIKHGDKLKIIISPESEFLAFQMYMQLMHFWDQ